MNEYRQHLVLAEQKAQEDYDKTLVSLSGGALAISFAFLDKVTKGPPFCLATTVVLGMGILGRYPGMYIGVILFEQNGFAPGY